MHKIKTSHESESKIEPALKQNAEKIFNDLGLSTNEALILFYKQVVMNHGLPFDINVPNEVTKNAIFDGVMERNLTTYNSVADLKNEFR